MMLKVGEDYVPDSLWLWALVTWRFHVERFVACGPEASAQTHTPPITTCGFDCFGD